ncbi:hypothetical protein [Providencia rettgeri]|uniref:hypothetical protein n=1 Tax=Providencia rettgeri TaxID=587 RepID=UPI001B362EC2|nr:hypothetical protein [Providencia rettgeri]MBQ0366844.1 hypothetical protein [Providencia rettgeri]
MDFLRKTLLVCSLLPLYGCVSSANIYDDTKDDTANNAVLITGGGNWSFVEGINTLTYQKNKEKFNRIYEKSSIPETTMFNNVVDIPLYSRAWDFEPTDGVRSPVKLEMQRDVLIIPPGSYKIKTDCITLIPPGAGYYSSHSHTQSFKANTYYVLTCNYVAPGPIIESSIEELK